MISNYVYGRVHKVYEKLSFHLFPSAWVEFFKQGCMLLLYTTFYDIVNKWVWDNHISRVLRQLITCMILTYIIHSLSVNSTIIVAKSNRAKKEICIQIKMNLKQWCKNRTRKMCVKVKAVHGSVKEPISAIHHPVHTMSSSWTLSLISFICVCVTCMKNPQNKNIPI